MINLTETYDIVQRMNEEAHNRSWNYWIQAEEEDDYEVSEILREDASEIQSSWFRDEYKNLTLEERSAIIYWVRHDKDFHDEFKDFFGHQQFDLEFIYE